MSATGHTWRPPADVIAAGEDARGAVRYGRAWAVAAGVQHAVPAAVEALRSALVRRLARVPSVGAVRPTERRAAASANDPHRCGFALDVMVAAGDLRASTGDAIANFLVRNARRLGLQYVLWSGYEWSASGSGAAWEAYTGTDPHADHVHVEVGPDAREWPASLMSARVAEAFHDAPAALALVPLAVAVGLVAFLGGW